MRSLLLATLAALTIPACTTDIAGGGGGGGGGSDTATCGNGVVDPGETCDDGNTINGDGCSSSCQTEDTSTPRVVLNVDKSTVATDLGVETDVTITATSMGGFAGAISLTATSDSGDWSVPLDVASLTMTDGGTGTAHVGITALGDTAMLTGNVTVTATAGTMTSSVAVAATFSDTLDVEFTNTAAACNYPVGHTVATAWQVKAGRKIAVWNKATNAMPMIVHVSNGEKAFSHEGNDGTDAGAAYTSDALTAQTGIGFWCHNSSGFLTDPGSANYQYLDVVP